MSAASMGIFRSILEMFVMGGVLMIIFVVIKYAVSMIPDGGAFGAVKGIAMAA